MGRFWTFVAAVLVFVIAGTFAPGSAVDEVTVSTTKSFQLAPASIPIYVKIKNASKLWCPAIEININDGTYYHSQESDCDPNEEPEPSAHDAPSWTYTHIPSRNGRTKIFGEGKYEIIVTLRQNGKTVSQNLTVNVLG